MQLLSFTSPLLLFLAYFFLPWLLLRESQARAQKDRGKFTFGGYSRGSDWKNAQEGFWDPRNILFLDLDTSYICVFTWWNFVQLHTYDLCIIYVIFQLKVYINMISCSPFALRATSLQWTQGLEKIPGWEVSCTDFCLGWPTCPSLPGTFPVFVLKVPRARNSPSPSPGQTGRVGHPVSVYKYKFEKGHKKNWLTFWNGGKKNIHYALNKLSQHNT